jgi:O-Antigen ligase
MSVLILVPGFISFFLVMRGRIETAFLSVYLPCLLFLPQYYSLRLPHLPPLSAAEFALIPLGLVGLSRLIRSGSFALMDILAFLFPASVGLSEILHAPVINDGIFAAFLAFVSMFLAYVAGRQLIEPNLRFAAVRKFVLLVLLTGLIAPYEYRLGQNLYGVFGHRILGLDISEGMQMRNGHARIGAVFGGGESAGIAFAMTFCLHAWLVYLRRVKAPVDLGKRLTKLEKYHVPGMLLLLCVWLTQSRGPQISLAAACLVLQIPRFKNTRLMTFLVVVLLVGGYTASSIYFDSYTIGADQSYAVVSKLSEQQQSAIYRRTMNKVYAPIAEAGGWTGWGVGGTPHVLGMKSIDNHYLLVHLSWGWFGYITLVLIVWENIRVLLVRSWNFKASQDRAFAFSMLAAMTVLWLTLLTVYMGEQLPQVSFLLMGWIQSMVPSKAATSSGAQSAENRNENFSFRRVFS